MSRFGKLKENKLKLGLVITGAVVILILIFVLLWRQFRIDTSEGLAKLEEMNKVEVQEVDERIRELENEERKSDEEWQNRSNDEKFEGCMVLGDSISQGLYEYSVLAEEFVAAEKGVGTHEPDSPELAELIGKAVSAKPQKIFLAFGMNDIGYDGGADTFKKDYMAMLEKLQASLPSAEIYINSILPANENAISRSPAFADVPEYNEKLREICEEKELTFIDNTDLVLKEYYANDGIHMSPDYYPVWVDHMAEEAEL